MPTKAKPKIVKSTPRTATFRERMRAKGYVVLFAWVPAKHIEKIREFIASLVKDKK
jgi:hypothetical protein